MSFYCANLLARLSVNEDRLIRLIYVDRKHGRMRTDQRPLWKAVKIKKKQNPLFRKSMFINIIYVSNIKISSQYLSV